MGRQDERASRVAKELRTLNPSVVVRHVARDLTLLKNVDEVCAEISAQESKVNILCLSAGFLSMRGQDATPEGLDKKLAINYYSRWRFVANLLPFLQGAAEKGETARVLSILGAGKEGKLILEDLALREKKNYTLRRVHDHATTMNSLVVEHLSNIYPNIGFLHAYPGWVHTNVPQGLGFFFRVLMNSAYLMLRPWVISTEESGQRHLFAATSEVYSPREAINDLSRLGSDGERGSGGYLLDWNGDHTGNQALLNDYRKNDVGDLVWKHTSDTFEHICGQKRS